MRIDNKTQWRTDQLKAILQQVSLTALDGFQKRKDRLKVTIVYSSNGSHRGHATLGGTRMTLTIPRDNVNKHRFAWVADHEFGHIRGQDHKQMTIAELAYDWNEKAWAINQPKFAWAEHFPLEKRES